MDNIEEADVKAAANTPTGEAFAEVRNQVAQFKTSSILIGLILNSIKKSKKYKEKGFKSFNDFIASIGLSMQMSYNLMNVSSVLENKFPEVLKKLTDDPNDAYLPSSKAMTLANASDITNDQKGIFTAPNSIRKIKEELGRTKESDDLPIERIAKSSKIFTTKVTNSSYVPDGLKTEVVQINAKFQRAASES